MVEELLGGGLQAAGPVHGGAVRELQHQQGACEWKAHPGGEHRRQRRAEGRLQGALPDKTRGLSGMFPVWL